MPAAPAPFHLLRNHSAPLSALHINETNTLLYTGDQEGYVGITDLSSRRVVRFWQAHQGGVLSLEEWDGHLISHGRDNKIFMYEPLKLAGRLGLSHEKRQGLPIVRDLDVNALNFCRFAIATSPAAPLETSTSTNSNEAADSKGKRKEKEGILVVPSLLDSEYADVYHLPTFKRLHSSFNYVEELRTPGAGSSRTGLIMSLHAAAVDASDGHAILRVGMGFEDGRVELWALAGGAGWKGPSDGRAGMTPWQRRYEGKKHNEAVMAMTANADLTRAWTVSADHQLITYDLTAPSVSSSTKVWSLGHIGHASLALSADERVLAVGGWDGKVRLFSSATGKPLGELAYHRDTVHSLCFAHARVELSSEQETGESTIELGGDEAEDSDGEDEDGAPPRERWLVSGGKDRRVALWGLMDFGGGSAVLP